MSDPRRLRAGDVADLPDVLGADPDLAPRPVLVLVGGAAGLAAADEERLYRLFRDHVVPAVVRCGAGVVDGGTDSGVMRVVGVAREHVGGRFPLVGVAVERTVRWPEDEPGTEPGIEPGIEAAPVDPRHSHVVLVPGDTWGEESPWLSAVASVLSGAHPSVTLLANGGEIAYDDAAHSLAAERPVVVLAGSGRIADAIAAARLDPDDPGSDARAVRVAASPLVTVVPVHAPERVGAAILAVLSLRTDGG